MKTKLVLALGGLVLALASCATTFYVPGDTELTIRIRHSSDYANFELSGVTVIHSEVAADLMPTNDTAGQWIEANGAQLRSTQWGSDVVQGNRFLTAVWKVTLSPSPGQGPGTVKLKYTKGHWGYLEITVEGPGVNGKPARVASNARPGPADAEGWVGFDFSDQLKP